MIAMRISIAAVFLAASTIASAAQPQRTVDKAAADYSSCIERFAKILALASDENADGVAQTALSACPAEREAYIEANRRYKTDWNDGTMKTTDNAFVERLLPKITEIRAGREQKLTIDPSQKPQMP
jgi:hypothetical protein